MSISQQSLVSPVLRALRNPLCLTSIFSLTVSDALWFFPLLVALWPLTHILGFVRILCHLSLLQILSVSFESLLVVYGGFREIPKLCLH